MNFTQHPSNNKVLGAPPGWDQKAMTCHALPVTAIKQGDQVRMVSFWRPTESERAAIASGALVQLSIFSASHPPVHIGVEGVPD